jgi:uncharacterized protein (UPF0335 family)
MTDDQKRTFWRSIRAGGDVTSAAQEAGIPVSEARAMLEQQDDQPAEAYEGLGHNSGVTSGHVAADELRQIIERVERLEDEKQGIADDIKDVKHEAKSRGYDVKAINRLIAIRKKKPEQFQEEEAILAVYMHALGMGL